LRGTQINPATADEGIYIMTTRKAAQDEPVPVDALEESGPLVVDFSTVTEMEALPADSYLCMVEEFSSGTSRNGNATMSITYTVQEPEEYANRKLRDTMSLQPQALFNLFNVMGALGEDVQKLKTGKFQVIPENYIGRTVVVSTRLEEYEGRERARIRRVQHADSWEEVTSF